MLTEVDQVDEQGVTKIHPLSSSMKEDTLIVDTITGTIYHPWFGNEFYNARNVLDYGSSVSSFKMLATSLPSPPRVTGEAPYVNALYAEIAMFNEGPKKPLIIVQGGTIAFGTCQ